MTREQAKSELEQDATRLEVKRAYAAGADIQFQRDGEWVDVEDPIFRYPDGDYRVKPSPPASSGLGDGLKGLIRQLRLPTTYKITRFVKGHLQNGKYVELAELHSGTAGHITVWAVWLDGGWKEISRPAYRTFVAEVFEDFGF